MKTNLLVLASIGSFFVTSCATKFTAEQKDALSTVAISPVEVAENAYNAPYGGDRQAANQASMAGSTSGTGALGGLVGSLVGESIAATQNNMFKGNNRSYFEAVKSNMPQLSQPVYSSHRKSIKEDPFFGSRLRESSPNTITSKITSYGLTRSGKADDGNLLLTPQVIIDLHLKDSAGKKSQDVVMSEQATTTLSAHTHPMRQRPAKALNWQFR